MGTQSFLSLTQYLYYIKPDYRDLEKPGKQINPHKRHPPADVLDL